MTTQQSTDVQHKAQEVRELFAEAPEIAKVALENVIRDRKPEETASRTDGAGGAGRIGRRQGTVSELTMIAPLAEGAAKRVRGLLELVNGNFEGADRVGSVHDMRFVFLENDTKLLFATAYDGDWDAYIDDFATKIPDLLDVLFHGLEGWPGIRSPLVKDFIVKYQLAADAWYVANPNLTVVEARRLQRVGKALDEFLDKIG